MYLENAIDDLRRELQAVQRAIDALEVLAVQQTQQRGRPRKWSGESGRITHNAETAPGGLPG